VSSESLKMLIALMWLIIVGSYGTNIYKLTQCDFVSPLKCEIVHTIGLLPVASVITVWIDTDEGDD
jgi:hypothetical protein